MKNSSLWIILQRMRAPFLVIVFTYTISIIGLLIIPGADSTGKVYIMSIFDAFYFITYTATTIGFGEIPYAFTYPQRMWVSFSVYFNVLGWFYGIGTLVALLQDKLFLEELAKNKFKRQIKNLREKYIIVLGYNLITSEIIKQALENGLRAVVIEKDQQKLNELILENFTPPVPVLNADAYNPEALQIAGISSIYCKAIVSLFQDDALNLRIALTSKILNPNVKMAVKSTTQNHTENLKDLGVEIIENPFEIIARQTDMALNSPSLLKLERWIYGFGNLGDSFFHLPKGHYIICGYGRMGKSIYEVFEKNGFESTFIEIDPNKAKNLTAEELSHIKVADGDDRKILKSVGIETASVIIAGTNNDTINLSILATAKKLNPDIMTIARENEMEDFSIFQSAKIDHIFMPSKILINKTINAIINPSADMFAKHLDKLSDKDASQIIKQLLDIDLEPILFGLNIDEDNSFELYKQLKKEVVITLDTLRKSLRNQNINNNMIVLMILRDNKEILLPKWDEKIVTNDIILFGCDENAKEEMQLIANNPYEFEYAFYGKEKTTINFWRNK